VPPIKNLEDSRPRVASAVYRSGHCVLVADYRDLPAAWQVLVGADTIAPSHAIVSILELLRITGVFTTAQVLASDQQAASLRIPGYLEPRSVLEEVVGPRMSITDHGWIVALFVDLPDGVYRFTFVVDSIEKLRIEVDQRASKLHL